MVIGLAGTNGDLAQHHAVLVQKHVCEHVQTHLLLTEENLVQVEVS
jgi:hypothetical protein